MFQRRTKVQLSLNMIQKLISQSIVWINVKKTIEKNCASMQSVFVILTLLDDPNNSNCSCIYALR